MMRPPDGRSKTGSKQITKTCRKCQKQLPTACKTCTCGFHFRKSSPPVTLEEEQSLLTTLACVKGEVQQTRARRTRCKRPHFFDSLEYGKTLRKKSRLSSTVVASKVNKKQIELPKNAARKSSKDAAELSSISSASATSRSSECSVSLPPASSSSSSSSTVSENRLRSTSCPNGRTSRENGSTDNPLLLSIVLAEINRKYMSVSFRPV